MRTLWNFPWFREYNESLVERQKSLVGRPSASLQQTILPGTDLLVDEALIVLSLFVIYYAFRKFDLVSVQHLLCFTPCGVFHYLYQ